MARRGRHPIVLSRKVDLLPQAARLYSAYLEIDRDGMSGRPLFAGMCAVLDELGIADREERRHWRALWRQMWHVESEIRERQAEERAEKAEAKAQGASPRKRGRRRERAEE